MANDNARESNDASGRVLQFRRRTDAIAVGDAPANSYMVQLALELLKVTAAEVESTNDVINTLSSLVRAANDTANLNVTAARRSLNEFNRTVDENRGRRTEIARLVRQIYQLLVDLPPDTDARLHELLPALD